MSVVVAGGVSWWRGLGGTARARRTSVQVSAVRPRRRSASRSPGVIARYCASVGGAAARPIAQASGDRGGLKEDPLQI